MDTNTMDNGHEMRWGGVAGIAAVILAIIARVALGATPAVTVSPRTIAVFLFDHRGQILAAALLYAVAVALLLWFGAALATAFRRADETSDASAVVLAGYVLICTIGFVAVSVFAGLTYALTAHPELLLLVAGPYTAIAVVGGLAGIAVALPMTASAVAIVRTHLFPVWMAWFAGLVALVQVLSAVAVVSRAGALAPGGALVGYVPGVLTGLWVLAASGLLVREHLPVITPRTAPPAVGHA
jgi:hypothetical protein